MEQAIRTNDTNLLAWYADVDGGGEIGDIAMNEAGPNLNLVMIEEPRSMAELRPSN